MHMIAPASLASPIAPPLAPSAPAIPSKGRSRHVRELDGIRGIAVILVLLYHFFIYHRSYAAQDPSWLQPMARLFDIASAMGWVGVEMFFVLSGFLITGILDDARGHAGYFRSFYGRRALRILPLYYAVLLIHLVVFSHETLPVWANIRYVELHQGWYWLFLTNFLFASPAGWHRLTSHFWTLAIEEQFYLVWPMLVFWLDRRHMMRLCQFTLCAAFALRLFLLWDGVAAQELYLLTPTELDGLVAGAFLALAVRQKGEAPFVLRQGRWFAAIAALVLAAVILLRRGLAFTDPVVSLVGFSSFAIVFGALIFLAARGSSAQGATATPLSRTLGTPLLTFFGRYSYAIYLLHMPIIQLWRAPQRAETWLVGDGMAPFVAHLCYVLVVSASVAGAALLSWYLFEQPMLALRPRKLGLSDD
ncbi:MAG: oatA 2 [Gemmatimonadetes bacterium]|nr:oatA 2 [Gemmatimonadota bacterium]